MKPRIFEMLLEHDIQVARWAVMILTEYGDASDIDQMHAMLKSYPELKAKNNSD